MSDLEQKYRNNRLTRDELSQLRREINGMDDEPLAQRLAEEWDKYDDGDVKVDDEVLERMRLRIGERTASRRNRLRIGVWLQRAACILLPVCLVAIWFLYNQNRQLLNNELVIATNAGEQACITLPDGTHVTLNSRSTLRYLPSKFNRSERQISFEGEAYFEVARDEQCPFRIDGTDLNIEVLGTKFNLQNHLDENIAVLTLLEGRVLMNSVKTKDSYIVEANENVVLDRRKGTMRLTTITGETAADAVAWQQKELKFHNTPLIRVLDRVSRNYGIQVKIASDTNPREQSFTGTLPTDDLTLTISILELSFGVKASMKDNVLYISKK